MLHQLLLIQNTTGILLYRKNISKDFSETQSDLMSGMLSALGHLSTELKIGQLTTFNAIKNKVLLSASEKVTCCLILDPDDFEDEWRSIAKKIGTLFESEFDLDNWVGELNVFSPFNAIVDSITKELDWKESPFEFKFQENLLLGFLIYDFNTRTYYKRFLEKFDIPRLFQIARSSPEIEFQVEKDRKNFFVYKTEYGGLIASFDLKIPPNKMKRLIKTFKFCMENLHGNYILAPTFDKYAGSYLEKKDIKLIENEAGLSIIDILTTRSDSLEIIENLRKIKLRELIYFQNN